MFKNGMTFLKNTTLNVAALMFTMTALGQQIGARSFALETDPITTVLGATTVWAVYSPKTSEHFAFGLNLFRSDFSNQVDDLINPKNKGQGFETQVNLGGGISVDYYLKSGKRGYYVGLVTLLFDNEVSFQAETKRFISQNIIPRAGYRWYPFPKTGLYLNPFLGLRVEYVFNAVEFQSSEAVYKAAGLQPFGSLHLGYSF